MDAYYAGNAIYDYITQNNYHEFVFAKENIWLLIYGDHRGNPKILAVVSALTDEEYKKNRFGTHEVEVMELAKRLAEVSGLVYRVIRYCKDDDEITQVQYIDYPTKRCEIINIQRLAKLFEKQGIKTKPARTHKYLNDKTSSAFHKWQREVLGDSITASDIDLVKEIDGRVSLYELKRSFIAIENWRPYRDDYANFRLIQNFADMVNAEFKIVYNRRTKEPYLDDIRKLKIFSFDLKKDEALFCDAVSLDDFLGGKYNG